MATIHPLNAAKREELSFAEIELRANIIGGLEHRFSFLESKHFETVLQCESSRRLCWKRHETSTVRLVTLSLMYEFIVLHQSGNSDVSLKVSTQVDLGSRRQRTKIREPSTESRRSQIVDQFECACVGRGTGSHSHQTVALADTRSTNMFEFSYGLL